ncbi:MAG: ribonuclease HII [Opitutales bacterium]|nr:ribonuclease HII [Opitutales bacterium]
MASLKRPASAGLAHDLGQATDTDWLVGVDEAGRGALAGPVVAAALAIRSAHLTHPGVVALASLVADSKTLHRDEREAVFARWEKLREILPGRAADAGVAEIEHHNILGATRLAMARAISGLSDLGVPPMPQTDAGELFTPPPAPGERTRILVDGRPLRPFAYSHTALVGGDGLSFVIGLASIIAKVTRDRRMADLHTRFPDYGFASHMGYGTPTHRRALLAHGPCTCHRSLFLRKILPGPTR